MRMIKSHLGRKKGGRKRKKKQAFSIHLPLFVTNTLEASALQSLQVNQIHFLAGALAISEDAVSIFCSLMYTSSFPDLN